MLRYQPSLTIPTVTAASKPSTHATCSNPTFNCVEIRKNYYLRGYRYGFIHMFVPKQSRAAVQEAMQVQSARTPEPGGPIPL